MMTTSTTTEDEETLQPMDMRPLPAKMVYRGPLGVARIICSLFTKPGGQREPPSPQKTEHVRFITITMSHYCEKVRWALDLLEEEAMDDTATSPIYYTEEGYPPGFQAFATLPATNYTASVTPLVVFEDGKFIKNQMKSFWSCVPFSIQRKSRMGLSR
jgi:hypothetical protein